MTSAHPLVLAEGRKLKHLASKGRLTTSALTAAGAAILAATQAQAHSGPETHTSHTDDGGSVIGMGLVGATHTHESGLHHNHGPLSVLPNGVQHTHPFGDGMPAGTVPGPMQAQMQAAQAMPYATYAPQQVASSTAMAINPLCQCSNDVSAFGLSWRQWLDGRRDAFGAGRCGYGWALGAVRL